MRFDDRLATVLRHRAAGERAARTQFRQLLDLLGERTRGGDESLAAAAFLRLAALSEMIPADERVGIVGEESPRIRNPALVRWFGEAEPGIAAAALGRAVLTGAHWAEVIPDLPIRARGFLRHRRDLPEEAVRVLDRLGVRDRVLPVPHAETEEPLLLDTPLEEFESADAPLESGARPEAIGKANDREGIAALVRRIEAFQRARDARGPDAAAGEAAPRLPLGEQAPETARRRIAQFAFGTDSQGRIDWAEPEIAPMIVGAELVSRRGAGAVQPGDSLGSSFHNRQPVRGARFALAGAEAIAGDWIVDAAPRFTQAEGRFYGYVGRFRRAATDDTAARAESAADRIRQLLHELRTPVNAIQGFAEVIQQQLFGATPHEYRALAATIAGDAARMLAGFDELDRLARLESGTLALEPGASDFAAVLRRQVEQLQTVLSPRVARFEARWGAAKAPVALAEKESEMLAWRMLGTLASATAAGEKLALDVASDGEQLAVSCDLPASLAAAEDIFSTETRPAGGAVSAGLFGAGFALRLARAEARAAGGELARAENRLVLSLPLLAPAGTAPRAMETPDRAAG